jgi:hypothetical protein
MQGGGPVWDDCRTQTLCMAANAWHAAVVVAAVGSTGPPGIQSRHPHTRPSASTSHTQSPVQWIRGIQAAWTLDMWK